MKKGLFVRLSEPELNILKAYCEQTDRTQSDVIRSLVRNLSKKLSASPPSRGVV